MTAHDLLGRLDPVHPRHPQVHHDHVGPAALGEGDGRFAVGGLADDADVRRAQEGEAQALADDLVVVCEEHGDLGGFGHAAILRVRSDEGELGRPGLRPERRPSVARVLAGERSHTLGDRSDLRRGQVAAASVEPLVARALVGPVAGERLEEVLSRARPQIEDVRPDVVRPGLPCRPDRLGELFGPVREPGQDRRDGDARADARVDEATDDLEPATGRRRARLGRAPDAIVERGDGDVDRDLGPERGLLEDVDVAPDERARA